MKLASHWSYAAWFSVLRIYTGLFWLVHGIPKFLSPDKFMPPNGFMPKMVQDAASSQAGPYHDFLVNVVIPNINIFAELQRLGEVLTGLALLFGLLTRLGGLVGCFLALNYMAAQGEFSHLTTLGSLDGAAFMLSFMMLVVPAGRVFGVDALMARPRTVAASGPRVTPEFVDEPKPAAAPPAAPPPATPSSGS